MSKRLKYIADSAYKLLAEIGINKPYVQIEKIASYLNLEIVTHDFGNEISGALILENDKATIGVSPGESEVRRRFTISHEIGHFLFHKDSGHLFVEDKKFQVMFRSDQIKQDYVQEKEANHFAACILMPQRMIDEEIRRLDEDEYVYSDEEAIKLIAKKFKVSQPAMTFRLINLGYYQK